jgi:hypothetical protein
MRRCNCCKEMKQEMAFKGINADTCRLCSYDQRDRSAPAGSSKSPRKCLRCDKKFMALMNKRLCDKCKSTF